MSMDKSSRIAGALAYAKKGWPVFPVGDNKLPAVKAWEQKASVDEEQINKWYETVSMNGCNFGFCPGRAGIAVIDLDVNKKDKDGKVVNGKDTFAAFCKEHGQAMPPTFTVQTPSGGLHFYYKVPHAVKSKNGFLPAVDVKSSGGYVVIPGSINANGGVYKVINDIPAADMPPWFLDEYGREKPAAAKEKTPLNFNAKITPDTIDKIERAIDIISGWEECEEGNRNDNLFQMMRELNKAGVSAAKAKELYRDHGINAIGLDPDSREVAATIASAYSDMSGFGAESAEAKKLMLNLFDALPVEENNELPPGNFGLDWTELEAREIPERKWFIENWLSADEGYTVLFSGRGGTGKSGLVLDLMRSLATGEPWCGMPVKRGAKTMYVSCEDSEEEIARRIHRRKGLSGNVPKGVVSIVSRLGADNVLCTADRSGKMKVEKFYHQLKREARAFFGTTGGVLILDTLSDVFAGDENNRTHVSQFVKYQLNRLGREIGVTIIVLAHPAKGGAKDGQGFSGSTAWEGAFRCRWELNYQDAGKVDGLLELVLAKSNSTRPGQKIALTNSNGLFMVVDSVEIDGAVKDTIFEEIKVAYEDRKPYGRTSRASRPISAAKIKDPVTGNWLTGDEIEAVVAELLAEGRVVYKHTNRGKELHPEVAE